MNAWPRNEAYFWQEAPFLRLVLPLALGIFCYDRWPSLLAPSPAVWTFLACAVAFSVVSVLRSRKAGVTIARALTLHSTLVFLGYVLASVGDVRTHPQWAGRSLHSAEAHLVVLEEPQEKLRIWRVPVKIVSALDNCALTPATGAAFLNFYKGVEALPYGEGDTVLVSSDWATVQNSGNPHSFNYARFLQRRGTHFQQFLGADEAVLVGRAVASQKGWIDRLHDGSIATLRHYVKDAAALGILEAMILGYEADFDPELRQAYAETGVIHIVAISGGHVAMLFLVGNGLLFWLRGRKARVFKYVLGVALVWVYVLVAGAPPSAVRSAVMFTVIALAFLARREGSALNTLCAAAFALLCYEPMWLFAVGFQLSFAAVLSLIIFYAPISRWVWSRWWIGTAVWKVVAASLAAQILTAPLSVYYFHNFPLWFLVANVFAWLLLGACGLVGGLLILALSCAPPLASLVAGLVTWLVKSFNWIVLLLQKGNPVSWSHLQISTAQTLWLYAAIGFAAIFFIRKGRLALHGALFSLCIFLTLLATERYAALKGDHILIYGGSRHTLVERITGYYHSPLFADTSWNAARQTTKDTRVGYRAWRTKPPLPQDVHRIGGKTVLLLTDTLNYNAPVPFGVDVLVVNRPLKGLSPARLKAAFAPSLLVLSGGHKRWRTLAWKDSCTAINQPLHAVGLDGGLVIE